MSLFTLWPKLYSSLLQPSPYRVAASLRPTEMPGTGHLLTRNTGHLTPSQSVEHSTPRSAAAADKLAAGATNPSPWDPKWETPRHIVDACAGAGGKTIAIGDAMLGRGKIRAYDRSQNKLRLLTER